MKLQKLKYKALAVLAIFTVGVGFIKAINFANVYADDSPKTSMSVSPMTQKIILTPGETYTGNIKVINSATSTDTLHYIAEIGSYNVKQDVGSKDDYGGFEVNSTTDQNTIKNWLSIDKTNGSIEPNEVDIITYTIKVPKDAPAGAQYASILVYENENNVNPDSNKTNENKANVGITNKYQLVSIIYANVAGETVEKGSIKENNMPSVLTNNKLEATSMVRNDGNIYTDATYTLQVWPLTSDEELCTNEEKAETSMVLPNTERYHIQTCNLPAVGIFRAKQVVKIFGEESVLEKTIFVCPVWLMILAIVIVVAIIAAIIIIIKKNKAKKSED